MWNKPTFVKICALAKSLSRFRIIAIINGKDGIS